MSEINLPSLNQKCQCGCGMQTKIALKDRPDRGWIKGQPLRFINGHNRRHEKGEKCINWAGGVRENSGGYIEIFNPDYRPNYASSYVLEHILIAEKVLGKPLPLKAIVHHVDSAGMNNKNSNLVICEDNAYHLFIHQRTRAFRNSGHADWRKCQFCKKYDDPENLIIRKTSAYHRKCENQYQNKRYHASKIKNRQLEGDL